MTSPADSDHRWSWFGGSDGQSTVELIVVVPLIAVVVLMAWQGLLVAHGWWLAQKSAASAARAYAVALNAGEAKPDQSAGRAGLMILPPGWRADTRVEVSGRPPRERVSVFLSIPVVSPLRAAIGSSVHLRADAGVVR